MEGIAAMDVTQIETQQAVSPLKGEPSGKKRRLFLGKRAKRALEDDIDLRGESLLSEESSFAVVEAYRSARTNLLFTKVGEGCQKIVFTSTQPSEGKSINCANLAATVAQNGKRVLLIDADLRCPVIHQIFNLPNQSGLSETLAGMNEGEKTPFSSTAFPNLYVMTAGRIPPNPAELLSSKRMPELLESLSERFDYIMIDTPPLSVVTDAAVLSGIVHGFILVVRAGHVPAEGVRTTVAKLERVGANILGFLLNDVGTSAGGYQYGRYKGYGRYGSKHAKGE